MGIDPRKILVDADACPRSVLKILQQISSEFHLPLFTVSSFNHDIDNPLHITVGNGPDEADLAIVNRVAPEDIVVTQDWGLAALVLGRKGRVLNFFGREYTAQRIDFLLDERFQKAKFRRSGGRTKGPAARTREDDLAFERGLRRILEEGRKTGATGMKFPPRAGFTGGPDERVKSIHTELGSQD